MDIEIGRAGEPTFAIEEVTDPAEIERSRAQHERARQNSAWLQDHWGDLLPRAYGKFVAVAGQEAFIADTAKEAWDWAAQAHPEDNGALVRFVRQLKGPRIYDHRGGMATG
jgi:hypothetical protein